MPTAIGLSIEGVDPAVVHPRLVHGAACALFEGTHAGASHHGGPKPFSVGPFIHIGTQSTDPSAAHRLEWRVVWLRDDIAPPLLGGSRSLRIGSTSALASVTAVHHRSLISLGTDPETAYDLAFVTPAYLARSGIDLLLPDPVVLTAGLARRWNAVARDSQRLDSDAVASVARSAMVTAVTIRSVRTSALGVVRRRTGRQPEWLLVPPASTPPNALVRTGFVGAVRLALAASARTDSELARIFGALMCFAGFAGVGRATTHGFGWVRVTPASTGELPPPVGVARRRVPLSRPLSQRQVGAEASDESPPAARAPGCDLGDRRARVETPPS